MAPIHNLFRLTARQFFLRPAAPLPALRNQSRSVHQTSFMRLPRKDSQDKDSINTEAAEYTKSGTDDGTARQEEAAFDPKSTDPKEEMEKAGKGNKESGNPLDVSPANPEVSKPRGKQEGGAQNSGNDSGNSKKQSGQGSPNKGKRVGGS